ncbi:MAG: hypothetical protein E4G94_09825, partial [ANME-2 cluster archaeon]
VSSIKTSSSDSKFIGVFKDLYSYPATFNLTSRNNPDLLWYDLDEKAGTEMLSFEINDRKRIPAHSFLYTTEVYPSLDSSELKVAWLGQPFSVVQKNSSGILLRKFLINENNDDCYLLGVDEAVSLPEGFELTVIEIKSNTAHFVLTHNDTEVSNHSLQAGDIFEYNVDLNFDGKKDNLVLRFNVDNISPPKKWVRISAVQAISPDVLKINDENNMLIGYSIDVIHDGNKIQVSANNDISLSENAPSGILNNVFHVKINEKGDTAALVKEIHGPDISIKDLNIRRCYRPEITNISVDTGIAEHIPVSEDMKTSGDNRTVDVTNPINISPAFDLAAGIFIILIALYMLLKKKTNG